MDPLGVLDLFSENRKVVVAVFSEGILADEGPLVVVPVTELYVVIYNVPVAAEFIA